MAEKSDLISHIIYELDEFKSVADNSWHTAIAKLKELLVEQTIKESKKSSLRRKIEKHSWWIILATISISALSIRYYSAVKVTDKITEKSGIIQRGDALQKILRYDCGWMLEFVKEDVLNYDQLSPQKKKLIMQQNLSDQQKRCMVFF